MAWEKLDTPMFTSNYSYPYPSGVKHNEFVTSDYFGGIPGDPLGGKTRVFTANNDPRTTYYVGTQSNGGPLAVDFGKPGTLGVIDHAKTYTMARTLGDLTDANQVSKNGRRVIVAWIGGGSVASQSLARDVSLSKESFLLQQFVPEFQSIRIPESHVTTTTATKSTAVSAVMTEAATPTSAVAKAKALPAPGDADSLKAMGQQLELVAKLKVSGWNPAPPAPAPPAPKPPPAGDGWECVLSKGAYGDADKGSVAFDALFAKSPTRIVRRECSTCAASHKEIYYKRLTSLGSLNLYTTLRNAWNSTGNMLHKDFDLHSSFAEASADEKKWAYCNYDDGHTCGGVGAFRDCGPDHSVPDQWSSFAAQNCGQQSVRFCVDMSGKHPPPAPTPAPAGLFGVQVMAASASGSSEYTFIGIDTASNQVVVDGSKQGGAKDTAPFEAMALGMASGESALGETEVNMHGENGRRRTRSNQMFLPAPFLLPPFILPLLCCPSSHSSNSNCRPQHYRSHRQQPDRFYVLC
jgi:hypothetical protein